MSPSLVRSVVAVILIFHGLGHALPAFPVVGRPLSDSHGTESWALSAFLGQGPSTALCLLLNLTALLTFTLAGLALGGWGLPPDRFPSLGSIGAGVSLAGLLLFWNAFPFLFPNKVGVLAVNLFLLQGLLLTRWPGVLFHE